EHGDVHAVLFKGFLDLGGHARAVGLLVVQDGDLFRLELLGNVFGGEGALLVVAADGAEEEVRLDRIGDQRRRGAWGDGDDAFLFVDVDRGNGGAGAGMGHGELGAGVHHAVGGRHGLLGFAAVVDQQGLDLHALDAAG